MNKVFLGLFCVSLGIFQTGYYGSTTAAVTLAGAIIKAHNTVDIDHKPKRKDCKVCEGKGWYMSGDGIKRIECNYCEP